MFYLWNKAPSHKAGRAPTAGPYEATRRWWLADSPVDSASAPLELISLSRQRRWGIDWQDVLAIGDGENDLPMLTRVSSSSQ